MNPTFLDAVAFIQSYLKDPTRATVVYGDAAVSHAEFASRIVELEGSNYGVTTQVLNRLNAENKTVFFKQVMTMQQIEDAEILYSRFNAANGEYEVLAAVQL